jgi:hypothetical protein
MNGYLSSKIVSDLSKLQEGRASGKGQPAGCPWCSERCSSCPDFPSLRAYEEVVVLPAHNLLPCETISNRAVSPHGHGDNQLGICWHSCVERLGCCTVSMLHGSVKAISPTPLVFAQRSLFNLGIDEHMVQLRSRQVTFMLKYLNSTFLPFSWSPSSRPSLRAGSARWRTCARAARRGAHAAAMRVRELEGKVAVLEQRHRLITKEKEQLLVQLEAAKAEVREEGVRTLGIPEKGIQLPR